MARNGKIARLPYALRMQVNERLENGLPGIQIVKWLNKQWEAQKVLENYFGKSPISEQNLTEWKLGGFLEWQKRREAMEVTRELADQVEETAESAGGPLSDKVAALLTMKYLEMVKALNAVSGARPEDWKRIRELCSDLVALRKGDHSAARIRHEQQRT